MRQALWNIYTLFELLDQSQQKSSGAHASRFA